MKRVGVIGGGQLAWMMGSAARSLGIELVIQTPQSTDPAVEIATETIFAPIDDAIATAQLATCCDVITFENEFVNLESLSPLAAQGIIFVPNLTVLSHLLDKYTQRCYLRDHGLPVPQFTTLVDQGDLSSLGLNWGFPLVVKARRYGYDGQGTFIIHNQTELVNICQKLGFNQVLIEEFIPFERELAIIAARSFTGEVVLYPVVETQQENQVCHRVIIPAELETSVVEKIEAIAHHLLTSLQAVGIFGIELFLSQDGQVLVNEIAPRTHNSGHFTLDACETSQFEQHLRTVGHLPLGNPRLKCGGAVMVNLLGYEYAHHNYQGKRDQISQIRGAYIHWYGKTEARPGRKLGHVTVLLDQPEREKAIAIANLVESIWYR